MATETAENSWTIRRARPDDAARIALLSNQLGYPLPEGEYRKRIEALAGVPDHLVLVADRGDEVIGWLHAFICPPLMAGREVEIGGLVVDEAQRRLGIGRSLMAEAERWAGTRDCTAIRVRSNTVRSEAHVFYKRQGYEELKTQHVFRKRRPSAP